ncbi:helix-turn-helix transcriptional regulator [Oerskovia flava]|uniref:helix-turn-helix transcriptional regulator n=1 Tax=Oerskovia flava TaxID=2986422 RepID=UPI00223F78FE|nr:LuxR C-terminal-related transcriptional regulator [Oerskovia sp. JB1-3-2]
MVTPTPCDGGAPASSALVLRHAEDLYRGEPVPPAAVERLARHDHWFEILPRPSEVPAAGTALVDDFRALTPDLRGHLVALALQGPVGAATVVRASAASTGWVEVAPHGRIEWASDLHRIAALAAAEPDDHRLAGALRLPDRSMPGGAALHLLLADEAVQVPDLVVAADFFAHSDRPSWAVHCLVSAADLATTAGSTASLAAAAANIAAFDGDFCVAERVLERFAVSDTRVLVRESAPARALRQALVENDPVAARSTVLARLGEDDLTSSATGEALAVYALANVIDGDVTAWEGFVKTCTAVPVPLHPEIVAIAATYGAPNIASEPHLGFPVAADGRGWLQLAACMNSALHMYREMRLGSSDPPLGVGTGVDNRLVRMVAATSASVMLAHNQHWSRLETALSIADETTDIVPSPLLRVSAETLRALVEAFQGEPDSARERVDRLRAEPALRRGYRLRMVLDSVEVMLEGQQGNYEQALALLSTRQPDILDLTVGPCGPVELFDFVDYALLLHQDEEAAARVERTRDLLREHRSERADFVLAACDAAIAARTTLTPAEELLARAQSLPFVYESARLRLVYAERLRRAGRTEQARRHLLRAELDLRSAQAGAWTGRVQRELRACRREIGVTVADLTEQEVRIAELAADGLSNKEIGARLYLSPRTVGGHLYKIYPKLGITTRAQLRDALSATRGE